MPKTILIVEDQIDALDMLALLFRNEGYQVITAQDGKDGFDTARNQQPDLVLTDLTMPKLSGFDLIQLLRGTPPLHNVPVIVMSAFGEEMLERALEAGANEVIPKPLRFDRLIDLTAHLVSIPRL